MRLRMVEATTFVLLLAALACGGEPAPAAAIDVVQPEAGADANVPEAIPEPLDETSAEADVALPDSGEEVAPVDAHRPDAEVPTREWPECENGDEPGCPCEYNEDCASGFCVQTGDGRVCTAACTTECPKGWSCELVNNRGRDITYICVPMFSNLCRPCRTDDDCEGTNGVTGRCLDHGAEVGSFCGGACGDTRPCPVGYTCKGLTVEGEEVQQCWPESGECECNEAAKADGATTACSRTNEFGTCTGERRCDESGLTACDALEAKAESCNGQDDDCDGQTDEGQADTDGDGLADCVDEDDDGDAIADGQDNCPVVANPEQEDCDLDGNGDACDDDGDGVSGAADCGPCDPNVHAGAPERCNGADDDCDGEPDETFEDLGKACDGADEDECPGGKWVCNGDGTGVTCYEPGEGSTETCDGIDNDCDQHTDEGCACTVVVCVGGVCTADPIDCDDGKPCTLDDCDPNSGCVHVPTPGAACDDADPCTASDVCVEDQCAGTPYSCDDQVACTTDTCLGDGTCANEVVAGQCLIDGSCYHSGATNPLNDCQECDPTGAPGAWSHRTGACDDADACTKDDRCEAGVCVGTAFTCDDGIDCTLDVCDGHGGCTYPARQDVCVFDGTCVPAGTPNPDNPCQECQPAITPNAWVNKANGSYCNDGNACTRDDQCTAGACGGTAYSCDDGVDCTGDICDGNGGCAHPVDTDHCLIEGECVKAGTARTDNECLACLPGVSVAGWSPVADGTACDDGETCTMSDSCQAGACAGTAYSCDDGRTCTRDVCDGSGGCTHALQQDFCLIDGICWGAGQTNPAAPCQVCAPSTSTAAWTPRPDGTTCDDGSACTENDQCTAGSCLGDVVSCSDDNVCTDDSCDPKTGCVHVNNAVDCSDGLFCTVGDHCVGGACAGTPRDCSGAGDQCNEGVCSEEEDRCAQSPKPDGTECDDGRFCTGPDTCSAGRCDGLLRPGCCATALDCDDGNDCTEDACDAMTGTCISTPLTGVACDDSRFCTVDDACVSGVCEGAARDCSGVADACNTGACDEDADSCVKHPANDGKPCASDDNVCTDDFCAAGVCVHANNVLPCDDGDACTSPDVCNGGTCIGTPHVCDDGLVCTDDVCDGHGGCDTSLRAGFCLIDGVCYTDQTTNPFNSCQACLFLQNTGGWSDRPAGAVCDDEDTCTGPDTCDGQGTCNGPVSRDVDGDSYADSACGGNDCDDDDASVHPGVPDPFEGISPLAQVVDGGGYHGYWLSAASDSNGRQHVASYNATTMDLEYLTDRDGYWATAIIDSAGDVGKYAAISVDGHDKVHIVYYDDTNNDLKYATNASGVWQVENATANTGDDSGQWAAIAVSADGNTVHVMYYNATTKKLNYRSRTGGKWSDIVSPDASASVGTDVVMTLDSKGHVHATYQDAGAGSLKYVTNAAGEWQFTTIVPSGSPGQGSAIAMDGADNPHVFYRDNTGYDLMHVWREGTEWKAPVKVIDGSSTSHPTGYRWGLGISKDGHLTGCVTWFLSTATYRVFRVDYANESWGVPGAYVWTPLDDGQVSGQSYCTVSLDPSGRHHVLWHDLGSHTTHHVTDDSTLPGWELVDGFQNRGYWSSLAREPNGTLHVAYYDGTSQKLRYARKELGGLWESELVDNSSANTGQYASIAVDRTGLVHIAYYDDSNDDLKYVQGTLGHWGTPEVVDVTGSVGQYTSVILDVGNAPYIAYYDVTNTNLKFARKVGSMWLTETLDNVGSAGMFAAAAMDGDGRVHIAYRTNTNGMATGYFTRYIRGTPGVGWSNALNIDTFGTSGEWIDIALDSHGLPHVSEYSSSGGEVRHLFALDDPTVPANWKTEVVTTSLNGTTTPGTYTSIGLDGQDNVYVSFWANGLVVATRDASSVWRFVTPDLVGAQYTSLVVTPGGEWHVSYLDSTWNTDLRYASNTLSGYTAPEVAQYYSADVGTFASVAITADGTPHISYYDATQGDLKYARMSEGVWFHTTLEHTNNVGAWSSIAAGPSGNLHFAYYDGTNVALRYGRLTRWSFQSVEVDRSPSASSARGQYNGIAVGSDNVVHISYYDDYHDDLRHAFGSQAGFTVETLDQVNSTGMYSSIAVDSTNAAHIAYQYNHSSGLDTRYIHNKTGAWSAPESVDTTGCQGEWTSIATDANQNAHISYKDCTGLDLKYATNKTGAWSFQPLDTTNNVGSYTSIALNSAGLAYIGYMDLTSYNVRLATNLSGAWQQFDVETSNNVGYYTHIAVGPDKKVYMGYYDATNADLRAAVVTLNNSVDQNCDGF